MNTVVIHVRSHEAGASYREVVERILAAWVPRVPPEVAERISAVFAERGDGEDPLAGDGVLGLTVPAAVLVPGATGDVGVQVVCRAVYCREGGPECRGKAIDVLFYPAPEIVGRDLGEAVPVMRELLLSAGARKADVQGWKWAVEFPGLSWIVGEMEQPDVAYGIEREERKEAEVEKTAEAGVVRVSGSFEIEAEILQGRVSVTREGETAWIVFTRLGTPASVAVRVSREMIEDLKRQLL